jgi:uncharacterized MAPEG superfamily protein
MTISLWCVFIAALLPIVCTTIAKWGFPGFDNSHPREWLARQQGWRARANAAQGNSWEALAIFSAAVFTAHLAHASQSSVDAIAIAFIIARLAFILFYVTNRPTLRSWAWLFGFGLSVALFVVAA